MCLFPLRQEFEKLLQCGRCKNAFYCSRECQNNAWKRHKSLDLLGLAYQPKVFAVGLVEIKGWAAVKGGDF